MFTGPMGAPVPAAVPAAGPAYVPSPPKKNGFFGRGDGTYAGPAGRYGRPVLERPLTGRYTIELVFYQWARARAKGAGRPLAAEFR